MYFATHFYSLSSKKCSWFGLIYGIGTGLQHTHLIWISIWLCGCLVPFSLNCPTGSIWVSCHLKYKMPEQYFYISVDLVVESSLSFSTDFEELYSCLRCRREYAFSITLLDLKVIGGWPQKTTNLMHKTPQLERLWYKHETTLLSFSTKKLIPSFIY